MIILFFRGHYVIKCALNTQIVYSDKARVERNHFKCIWYVIVWKGSVNWKILDKRVISLKYKKLWFYLYVWARGRKCNVWNLKHLSHWLLILPKRVPYCIIIWVPVINWNIYTFELTILNNYCNRKILCVVVFVYI